MHNLINQILDWSEVWALAIPLAVMLWSKKNPAAAKPMAVYVCVALVINFLQDYIWKNHLVFSFSSRKGDNAVFYNIHSIIRFLLFSWFFIQITQPFLQQFKKMIFLAIIMIILVSYIFFESFLKFSGPMLAIEAGGILFYCLLFYINLLMLDDETAYKKDAAFWLITGISIYMVINFPLFLFYNALSEKFKAFAVDIWDLHNVTYCLLCIFMARYFNAIRHE